jgi:hypothetical protein
MLVANEIVRGLPLRSLKIQRLPDQEDIERATDYAAKSLDRLNGWGMRAVFRVTLWAAA